MWFRFDRDFDFSPVALKGRSTIAYKAGMVVNVNRECADGAKKAGAGSPTKSPKESADGDVERSR
jgi:hypothetical protein